MNTLVVLEGRVNVPTILGIYPSLPKLFTVITLGIGSDYDDSGSLIDEVPRVCVHPL